MQCSVQGESHWLCCLGEQLLGMTDNCPPIAGEAVKVRTAQISCVFSPGCVSLKASGPHALRGLIIHSTTYHHVLLINGVSKERAPTRRPDWGFSSVAEANLFRIRGINWCGWHRSIQHVEAEAKRGRGGGGGGAMKVLTPSADCVLAAYRWWCQYVTDHFIGTPGLSGISGCVSLLLVLFLWLKLPDSSQQLIGDHQK